MHWLTSQFVQIDDTAHALPSARTPCSSILLSFPSASHLQRTIYRTFLCLLHISRHTVREQRSDMACDSCIRDVIVLPCDWSHERRLLDLLRCMAAPNTAEGTDRSCMLGSLLICEVSVPHAYPDRCCGMSASCCALLATPGFGVSQVLPPIAHQAVVLKHGPFGLHLRTESLLVGLLCLSTCHMGLKVLHTGRLAGCAIIPCSKYPTFFWRRRSCSLQSLLAHRTLAAGGRLYLSSRCHAAFEATSPPIDRRMPRPSCPRSCYPPSTCIPYRHSC